MYTDRIPLYRQLEERRGSSVVSYVTGDRRGLETQVSQEVLDFLVEHLDPIGTVPKISLFLYTQGGQTLAAWSIANLLLQFCSELEILIPSKAHSAGTLLCLAADRIVMTKQATLGPIDPSVNTPLNPPIPGAPANIRYPVSVEAINGFIELSKQTGVARSSDLTSLIASLSSHVHPLVLGDVYRTRAQIRMLGMRLLSRHMTSRRKIDKILSFLCSESGSHDYTIYRQEARQALGLSVETPDENLYRNLKALYDDLALELQLTNPYEPEVLLGQNVDLQYSFRRAIIESAGGGSHVFMSEGRLTRRINVDQATGAQTSTIDDTRLFEGWRHEPLQA